MEEGIGRYHRFRYLGDGVTILYEPAPDRFHWLSMYVPPRHRGCGVSHVVFGQVVGHLPGTHWIHCSATIRPFKELSIKYGWKRLGSSRYFYGCSCYLFAARAQSRDGEGQLRMRHEVLIRRPRVITVKPRELNEVIHGIDRDFSGRA